MSRPQRRRERQQNSTSDDRYARREFRRAALLIGFSDSGFCQGVLDGQVKALDKALAEGWRAFGAAMPDVLNDTVDTIAQLGATELVVVPMQPHYGSQSTGRIVSQLSDRMADPVARPVIALRASWYDDGNYIDAQVKQIQQALPAYGMAPSDTHLLFAAKNLSSRLIARGDPYVDQVEISARLVARRLGWPANRASLALMECTESGSGKLPSLEAEALRLRDAGARNVLICALSSLSESSESLQALTGPARISFDSGGGRCRVCRPLESFPPLINALKNIVVRGVRPMDRACRSLPREWPTPQETKPADAPCIDRLFMIGVLHGGMVGRGKGPALAYVDADELSVVKRPQVNVPSLLREIQCKTGIFESWIWNTCHRFELYGLFPESADMEMRQGILTQCREVLSRGKRMDLRWNELQSLHAWHHLLRSVCGLNSGLPGDQEVAGQLNAGLRLARHAGLAGAPSAYLVDQALRHNRRVRKSTEWGQFDTGYCHAALHRTIGCLPQLPHSVVAIGGSTTCRSVLSLLVGPFGLSSRNLTLIHRGQRKGQGIKLLRKAVGGGRRIRVDSYLDPRVSEAMANADLIVFGLDLDVRILTDERVAGLRDFRSHPLVILDFNSMGSTNGLESCSGISLYDLPAIEREVEAYARQIVEDARFNPAVTQVETMIVHEIREQAGARSTSQGPQSPSERILRDSHAEQVSMGDPAEK